MGNAGEARLDVIALARDEVTAAMNKVSGELDALKAKLARYESSQRASGKAAEDSAKATAGLADRVKDLAKAGGDSVDPLNRVKELAGKIASNWLFVKDAVGGAIEVFQAIDEMKFAGVMAELRRVDKVVTTLAGTFADAATQARDLKKATGEAVIATKEAELKRLEASGDLEGAARLARELTGDKAESAAASHRKEGKEELDKAVANENMRRRAAAELITVNELTTRAVATLVAADKAADKIVRDPKRLDKATFEDGKAALARRELFGTKETPGLIAQQGRLMMEAINTGAIKSAEEYARAKFALADAIEKTAMAEQDAAAATEIRRKGEEEKALLDQKAKKLGLLSDGSSSGGGGGAKAKAKAKERIELDDDYFASLSGYTKSEDQIEEEVHAKRLARTKELLDATRRRKAAERELEEQFAEAQKKIDEEKAQRHEEEVNKVLARIGQVGGALNSAGFADAASIVGQVQKAWTGMDNSMKGIAQGVLGSIDAILAGSAKWFDSEKEKVLFLAGKEAALAIAYSFFNPAEAATHGIASAMLFALAGTGGAGGSARSSGGGASSSTSSQGSQQGGGGGPVTNIVNINALNTDRQTVNRAIREVDRASAGNGYAEYRGT